MFEIGKDRDKEIGKDRDKETTITDAHSLSFSVLKLDNKN